MLCPVRCCSQDMLPKARVLYCSATGVTDIGERSLQHSAGGVFHTILIIPVYSSSESTDNVLYELHTGVACCGSCAPGYCTNASWTRGVCIVYRFVFFRAPPACTPYHVIDVRHCISFALDGNIATYFSLSLFVPLHGTGNLAYATRLGLWGPQAPFHSFKEFKESMEKRGLGALEMLAMELKAKGAYVSRGLGWKGAEFETLEVTPPRIRCAFRWTGV